MRNPLFMIDNKLRYILITYFHIIRHKYVYIGISMCLLNVRFCYTIYIILRKFSVYIDI